MGETDAVHERAAGARPSDDDRLWAVLAHLLTIAVGFVAPLVAYLVQKGKRPFVERHAKESLNFQITMLLAYAVSIPLVCIGIGFVLLVAISVTNVVLVVLAGIAANDGKEHRYPFALRLVA